MTQGQSSAKKTTAILKTAQEKAALANLASIVHKGHALIRVEEGKEEIVAACLKRDDAAAIYAVIRAFYSERMDEGDDEGDAESAREGQPDEC